MGPSAPDDWWGAERQHRLGSPTSTKGRHDQARPRPAVLGTGYTAEIEAKNGPFHHMVASCTWFKDGHSTSRAPYRCQIVAGMSGDFNDVNFSAEIDPNSLTSVPAY